MTLRELQAITPEQQEVTQFVERALLDFGLMEAFESRPSDERAEYLRWIGAASGERAQEVRVSRLLDDLAGVGRLV